MPENAPGPHLDGATSCNKTCHKFVGNSRFTPKDAPQPLEAMREELDVSPDHARLQFGNRPQKLLAGENKAMLMESQKSRLGMSIWRN